MLQGLTLKLSELQWVHIGGEGEDVYEAHSELLILDGKLPWGSDALLHGGGLRSSDSHGIILEVRQFLC